MLTSAERSRTYRRRLAERRLAEWLDDPATVDMVRAALRSPDLLVWQSPAQAMRELQTFGRAWFGRGLALPPSPEQLAYGVDALVVPGAGDSAAAAMDSVPRRGYTYRLWGAVVTAASGAAARAGAWAVDQLARLAGRRPRRRRRTPSPVSPSPVTDSLASSSGRPVDDPRIAWHPPSERPPGDMSSLAQLMPTIAAHYTDRPRR